MLGSPRDSPFFYLSSGDGENYNGYYDVREKAFEENYENTLDALMDFMKSLPQPTLKVLNTERYALMLKTAADLKELLCQTAESGCIDIDLVQEFNLGSISFEAPDLVVYDSEAFAKIISVCDNIEIYPLTNGNLRLNLTFQSVLKPIA